MAWKVPWKLWAMKEMAGVPATCRIPTLVFLWTLQDLSVGRTDVIWREWSNWSLQKLHTIYIYIFIIYIILHKSYYLVFYCITLILYYFWLCNILILYYFVILEYIVYYIIYTTLYIILFYMLYIYILYTWWPCAFARVFRPCVGSFCQDLRRKATPLEGCEVYSSKVECW